MDTEWEEWDPSKGSFHHHMLAGSAAGVAEHLVMFPVDTYKTHVQFCRGTPISFFELMRKEGFLRLWRGAPATFAACIPTHATYFAAFEAGKDAFGANAPGHHPVAAGAAGVLATALHDAILTPMDLVKQRLQLGYYRGALHCLATVFRTEGIAALYRSYPTTLVMNMPYAAVAVATNESLRKVLTPEGQQPGLLTFLLSGAGAGALAAAVTCPLDVVKTRLQTASLLSWGEAAAAAAPPPSASGSLFSAAAASATLQPLAPLGSATPAAAGISSKAACPSPAFCARAPLCSAAGAPASGAASSAAVAAASESISAGAAFATSASAASSSSPPTASADQVRPRGVGRGLLGKLFGSSPLLPRPQVAMLYTAPAGRLDSAASAAAAAAATAANGGSSARIQHLGALAAARQLVAEGGYRAFLRGVTARMAAHTPAMAVSWASYETIKRLLTARQHGGGGGGSADA